MAPGSQPTVLVNDAVRPHKLIAVLSGQPNTNKPLREQQTLRGLPFPKPLQQQTRRFLFYVGVHNHLPSLSAVSSYSPLG